eukprot:8918748-Lingulodinium_polyedra.AAC.1
MLKDTHHENNDGNYHYDMYVDARCYTMTAAITMINGEIACDDDNGNDGDDGHCNGDVDGDGE